MKESSIKNIIDTLKELSMKKKRLIDTLPIITAKALVSASWITVKKYASLKKITSASVYNKIKREEIKAANFEGKIFVKRDE